MQKNNIDAIFILFDWILVKIAEPCKLMQKIKYFFSCKVIRSKSMILIVCVIFLFSFLILVIKYTFLAKNKMSSLCLLILLSNKKKIALNIYFVQKKTNNCVSCHFFVLDKWIANHVKLVVYYRLRNYLQIHSCKSRL